MSTILYDFLGFSLSKFDTAVCAVLIFSVFVTIFIGLISRVLNK